MLMLGQTLDQADWLECCRCRLLDGFMQMIIVMDPPCALQP